MGLEQKLILTVRACPAIRMDEDRVWGCGRRRAPGRPGSVTARELARRGFSVLMLEEHHEVGRPVQCAGLVTRRVFDAVRRRIASKTRSGRASWWLRQAAA